MPASVSRLAFVPSLSLVLLLHSASLRSAGSPSFVNPLRWFCPVTLGSELGKLCVQLESLLLSMAGSPFLFLELAVFSAVC